MTQFQQPLEILSYNNISGININADLGNQKNIILQGGYPSKTNRENEYVLRLFYMNESNVMDNLIAFITYYPDADKFQVLFAFTTMSEKSKIRFSELLKDTYQKRLM